MWKGELSSHFDKIDELISEINSMVPPDSAFSSVKFRSDLAGLLVVTIAATYETCVKETLCQYAQSHNRNFGEFAERNFQKLNSRISLDDLYKYCETFDPKIKDYFKENINKKVRLVENEAGLNITSCYKRILTWRHDFAHAWGRTTTLEEAARTHRAGRIVLILFNKSFNKFLP